MLLISESVWLLKILNMLNFSLESVEVTDLTSTSHVVLSTCNACNPYESEFLLTLILIIWSRLHAFPMK